MKYLLLRTKPSFWFTCAAIILFNLSPLSVKASHFMGGDMTYKCLGGNEYLVQLTVYRDCNSGNIFNPFLPLNAVAVNCGYAFEGSFNLRDNYPITITPLCEQEVDLCDSPTGAYGVEEFVYEETLTLPNNCSQILVSFTDCCRNAAISTLADPNNEEFYVGCVINTQDVSCNSSPQFNNNPTPFSCVGQEVNYNHGVTDADGDNLVFSLVNCAEAYNDGVAYMPPFSGTNPLQATDLAIDSETGAISFVPTALQVGIICVKVEEFRNGVKIGEITRDIQFTVLNCATNTIDENILPILSGIDGTASETGTTGDFEIDLCFGVEICFSMDAFDQDGHNLELSWNQGVENAVFTVNNNGTPLTDAEFCWTPTSADLGVNFFTVTVKDDACDIRGINTYTFLVRVNDGNLDYTYVQNDISCFGGIENSATITINDPLVNPTITWPTTPPQMGLTANNLSAGTYLVVVQDVSIECQNASIEVIIEDKEAVVVISDGTTSNVSCGGDSDGILDINISGGIEPYQIIWSNNSTDTLLTNIEAGTYTVTVTDDGACSIIKTFNVLEPETLTLAYSISDYNGFGISCTGGNDGFVNLSVEGGTADFMYLWSNNATSQDLETLEAGDYIVTVTDANGCQDSLTILLDEPSPLNAVLDNIATTCYESRDGSIVIENITGAVAPYSWSLGGESFSEIDTFPIIIPNQSRGDKTVYFKDDVACIYTNVATIDAPDSLIVTIIPADTLIELGQEIELSFLTNATDVYDFTWTSTQLLACDTCPIFQVTPLVTTGYTVDLTEINKGCKGSGSGIIRVIEESFIFVPNAFTPNDDGYNDLLQIYAQSEAVEAIQSFEIYDRWGGLVYQENSFQANDVQIGWNGNINGKEAPVGVYVYALEVVYINGKRQFFSGDVSLVR